MQDILNKSEVEQLLGVSARTLEQLARGGKFPPPVKLDKRATWLRVAVEKWLRERSAYR